MSIALVVTRGYGNGTLTGSIAEVVTRGYTIGEAAVALAFPFVLRVDPEQIELYADKEQTALTVSPEDTTLYG